MRLFPNFSQISESSYNSEVLSIYEELRDRESKRNHSNYSLRSLADVDFREYSIAVVPGAFFKEFPQHDARGQRLVEAASLLGCKTDYISVPSFCSPRVGADKINRWFDRSPEKRVVLVSLSKGSADAACFFSNPNYQGHHKRIRAWISISGIFCGTPLVNRIMGNPLKRLGISTILACE